MQQENLSNTALIQALARVQDALLEAVDTIDELGGGSESTYDNLDACQSAIGREIEALTLIDAAYNPDARP